MEIILRKTKLSNNIVKQLMFANLAQMESYEPIGWVYHDKRKKVILYNLKSNSIAVIPLDSVFVIAPDTDNNPCIKWSCDGFWDKYFLPFAPHDELAVHLEKLNGMLRVAKIKGQIFI